MPEREKRENYFRNLNTLNLVFLITGALMLVTVVWMVWADWDREFKDYQREFYALEEKKAQEQLDSVWTGEQQNALSDLEAKLAQAKEQLTANSAEAEKADRAFAAEDVKYYDRQQRMNFAKAEYESLRYDYEVARNEAASHGGHAEVADAARVKMEAKLKDLQERTETFKQTEQVWTAAKAEKDKVHSGVAALDKSIAGLMRESETISKRKEQADLSLAQNKVRDIPLIDFVSPLLRVRQISVDNLYDDLNFLQVSKIDSCTTCHLAIDKPQAYADEKQPFRSHPHPELYATSGSPHPMERFGCSGCHYGASQATTFVGSYHYPRDEAQRKEWQEKYGWRQLHDWDYPMFPAELAEALCFKCHSQRADIPGAPKLARGKNLVEYYGCFGCHKIEAFDGYQKVGPDLYHITEKVNEDWMLKWIREPKAFRATTKMPQFFDLSNTEDDKEWVDGMKWGVRNHAEIEAITAFLISRVPKEQISMLKYPGNGDVTRGKDLFNGNGGLGCLACHAMDDNKVDNPARHGPDLSGIGSKTNPDWVFTWLKNPKHYRPDTPMPSLRLTDEEAADLTAYLMSKHNSEFESSTFERAPEAAFKAIWLDFLLDKQPEAEARKTIDAMDPQQRKVDLGKRLVERYGCFGCHKISGYETANPIGTELSGSQAWGSKDVEKLDFGLLHSIEHSRNAWFKQKLTDTRIYDEGKIKLPLELLKMPKFNLEEGEISDIAVFIQSLVTDKITPEIAERLSPAQQRVEKGRKLVQHYNCRGCHELENFGGDIQQHIVNVKLADGSTAEDTEYYPPPLNGEGFKTQPEWLFEFLRSPVPLRPWLKARMPTFAFSDEEANAIVTYFNHQENWQNAADRDLWMKQTAIYNTKNPSYDLEKLAEGRFLSDEDRAKLSPQEQKILAEYEGLTTAQKAERRELRDMAVARTYRAQGGKFLFDLEWPYRARWEDELKGNDLTEARQLFKDGYQCLRCHPTSLVKAPAGGGLAPNLALAQRRLRPDWVPLWLQNPQALQPGTKMPNNFTYDEETKTWKSSLGDGARHMKLLRDYLYSRDFIENTPVVDR